LSRRWAWAAIGLSALTASAIPWSSVFEKRVAVVVPGRLVRGAWQGPGPLQRIIGREKILKVHVRKVPLAPAVNLKTIARGTPGFSGADLMNLVNEAALLAARRGKRLVTMLEFDSAKDKVKDLAGDHEDKVDQGLDKAGDLADDKTGGKYSGQIDQGKDKAGDYLSGDNEDNNN